MTTKDKSPRFTVIIPTKDRAEFLHHTLKTCSFQEYDNLEVLVSDDGSLDHTREVVGKAARQDPRIKYISPGANVGMLDNFEFALNHVKPGFVIALGGDDGLLPGGIAGMRNALDETNQMLLTWPVPAFYYPSSSMARGQLVLCAKYGRPLHGLRTIRSETYLKRQAKELRYVDDNESPMFYIKGVVSTDLVNKVRSRSPSGRFYSCSTPDGYSGIVLAGEVKNYAFSGVPYSIGGSSPQSAGEAYLSNDDRAKRQSEKFFNEALKKPMHPELACQEYSPLITLMTADFLLTARDLPGWDGHFPPIDYKKLLLKALAELANARFGESRVARELSILNEISEFHGLGDFFRSRVASTRRNQVKFLQGNAISLRRIFLDATDLGIKNIVDAAYITKFLHTASACSNFSSFRKAFINSARYRFLSSLRGAKFPPESEWVKQDKR